MKTIGLLLISIAFLLGSYLCVVHQTQINWTFYGVAIVLGIIGVILVQLSKLKSAKKVAHDINNMITVEKCLSRIITEIDKLKKKLPTLSVYSVPKQIDDTILADLDLFIEHRKTIAYVYDLQSYSNIMSEFACGERYLNRVWCAAADGYIDEVESYLGKAQEQFTNTQKQLNMVKYTNQNRQIARATVLKPATGPV